MDKIKYLGKKHTLKRRAMLEIIPKINFDILEKDIRKIKHYSGKYNTISLVMFETIVPEWGEYNVGLIFYNNNSADSQDIQLYNFTGHDISITTDREGIEHIQDIIINKFRKILELNDKDFSKPENHVIGFTEKILNKNDNLKSTIFLWDKTKGEKHFLKTKTKTINFKERIKARGIYLREKPDNDSNSPFKIVTEKELFPPPFFYLHQKSKHFYYTFAIDSINYFFDEENRINIFIGNYIEIYNSHRFFKKKHCCNHKFFNEIKLKYDYNNKLTEIDFYIKTMKKSLSLNSMLEATMEFNPGYEWFYKLFYQGRRIKELTTELKKCFYENKNLNVILKEILSVIIKIKNDRYLRNKKKIRRIK